MAGCIDCELTRFKRSDGTPYCTSGFNVVVSMDYAERDTQAPQPESVTNCDNTFYFRSKETEIEVE